MRGLSRRRTALVAVTALVVTTLAACGGDSPPPPAPAATSTPTATATSTPTVAATSTPTAAATSTPTAAATPTPTRDTQIKIVGSDSFIAQVEAALYLLGVHAPEALVWVEESVATVFLTPFPSGTAQDVIEGKVRVAQDQAFASGYAASDQVLWLAGALVFEACVINLYRGGGDYYSDTAAVTCFKEQIAALKRLDRSNFFAGMIEDHLYGTYSHDFIESVPDPDY